jgi:hypothetical protein
MGLDGGLFTGAIEFLGEMGLDGGFFTNGMETNREVGVYGGFFLSECKLIGRWAFTAAFFKVSVN